MVLCLPRSFLFWVWGGRGGGGKGAGRWRRWGFTTSPNLLSSLGGYHGDMDALHRSRRGGVGG